MSLLNFSLYIEDMASINTNVQLGAKIDTQNAKV